MRTVAVYPGRFHVFHRGHQAVYNHLVKQYGPENVYIATSAKQNDTDSPFTYADKVTMMTKMGVPVSRIIQVTNPYKIEEMVATLGLDGATDHLVYALGEKDANRFKYTPESPLQLLSQTKKMKPVDKHAYVETVPTATFSVQGRPVTSASEIRKMYLAGDNNTRNQIIADLYGEPDPELKAVFDERLGINEPTEGIIYGQERIYAGDQPVSVMREERLTNLRKNILFLQDQVQRLREGQDYIDEKWSKKYKKSINCSNPQGFSQKAHCAARRRRAKGQATKSKPV
jgi:nicotinamide mononucleotide adenylyltransferase